uniref:Uncharacterized protein n=1 Tax=Romanomermis culicivorax TaxID=13658 RepID=A0A915JWS4_ROMCU
MAKAYVCFVDFSFFESFPSSDFSLLFSSLTESLMDEEVEGVTADSSIFSFLPLCRSSFFIFMCKVPLATAASAFIRLMIIRSRSLNGRSKSSLSTWQRSSSSSLIVGND